MKKTLPIIAILLVIALLIPATSASPDIPVDVVSDTYLAPDVEAKLEAICNNLIKAEMSDEIKGAYRVMGVCFVAPAKGDQYKGELYVIVLSATDWCAVTSKVECDLNVADSSYALTSTVEHDVPLPTIPFDDSGATYAKEKGLADTPCGDIPSAVTATNKIHKYFTDALGSSTKLIGEQAKRSTIMEQLKYNKELIAWSNIGHGSPTGLVMYDGTITSNNFCNMPKWNGLKDCVCFVNSCSSCLDPLLSCILGGTPPTPDHKVRTYISGLVGLPIGSSDDTDREFWRHTLLECYRMDDALDEADTNHGLSGYYCLVGDDGKFFPPLVITTTVDPASCVVLPDTKMTISAKAKRYVFPDEEVCLLIYNAETHALVFEKCWTITEKTKELFTYKWKASVEPGTYYIVVIKEDCEGFDVKWFVVDPKGRKKFIVPAYEWNRGIVRQATGWVKPTECRTFKTKSTGGPLFGDSSGAPFSSFAGKNAYSDDKTYGEYGYRWTYATTGTYSTTIQRYGTDEYNGTDEYSGTGEYSGTCVLDYYARDDWWYWGGSESHSAWQRWYGGSNCNGEINDWTKVKCWWMYPL